MEGPTGPRTVKVTETQESPRKGTSMAKCHGPLGDPGAEARCLENSGKLEQTVLVNSVKSCFLLAAWAALGHLTQSP